MEAIIRKRPIDYEFVHQLSLKEPKKEPLNYRRHLNCWENTTNKLDDEKKKRTKHNKEIHIWLSEHNLSTFIDLDDLLLLRLHNWVLRIGYFIAMNECERDNNQNPLEILTTSNVTTTPSNCLCRTPNEWASYRDLKKK